jgi:hypothetical protein
MHKHGLLAGQLLDGITQLNDLVAVDTTHPGVDVPANSSQRMPKRVQKTHLSSSPEKCGGSRLPSTTHW